MNFSALFIGTVVGTLAAVAAFVIHDSFDPGFYFLKNPVLILFPLLVAGAQAFFLGLPTLLVLNRFNRLNWDHRHVVRRNLRFPSVAACSTRKL